MKALFRKTRFIFNHRGFNMIELLAVGAMIGIISTFSAFQIQKSKSRSIQNRAKIHLSEIFANENTFYSEFGHYTDHVDDVFFPDGNMRYNIGFHSNNAIDTSDDPHFSDSREMAEATADPSKKYPFQVHYLDEDDERYSDSNKIKITGLTLSPGDSRCYRTCSKDSSCPFPPSQRMDRYNIYAIGYIVPKLDKDNLPADSDLDKWRINERRQFTHCQNPIGDQDGC